MRQLNGQIKERTGQPDCKTGDIKVGNGYSLDKGNEQAQEGFFIYE